MAAWLGWADWSLHGVLTRACAGWCLLGGSSFPAAHSLTHRLHAPSLAATVHPPRSIFSSSPPRTPSSSLQNGHLLADLQEEKVYRRRCLPGRARRVLVSVTDDRSAAQIRTFPRPRSKDALSMLQHCQRTALHNLPPGSVAAPRRTKPR